MAVLAMGLSGCDLLFDLPEWQWHQKLTVSVMTPEGLKSGSSVTSARIEFPPKWTGVGDAAGMQRGGVSGEAVAVDLGEGRYLFALLQGYTEWTAYTAFFPELEGKAMLKKEMFPYLDQMVASTGQSRDVPRKHYPLLVTFEDINDPASVRRVNPSDLSAAFGAGYLLHSITMWITDEPVTEGRVKSLLPWLHAYYSKRFDGQRFGTIKTNNPFANSLASGAFDTEKSR
ncbi:hypothetical protein [Rhizobium sp. SL42]|uniref:hypothetical protein n=1 Tax=Rhizobium sp. SL42 TaxID=2806346 RepID=UPI001F37A099|nr:hypothetical protein [Rhizobium sp. SL42]UJW73549.1 hypothetical protein IM739_11570 [Rhizobium sp. SL42]